jgi:uncharacterized membrane-anchored protein YitT (DUF2179 family)
MYKWRNLNNKRHEIYSYFIMETNTKIEVVNIFSLNMRTFYYQQICSEKKQTSGLYLITSPCCWTWWLHVLTCTLKLYSLNVSGNVYILILSWKQIQKSKLLIYFCWIWELLTECFYTAFQNNLNSYTNSASQSIESIAKIIARIAGHNGCMCLHELWNFILWMFPGMFLSYILHLW